MSNSSPGYSFQPFSQSVPISGSNRSIGGPQSAVEVRSLTLPNRFVPGQIAPQQLLQSAGGAGSPEMAVLRHLMQIFAPQGDQPGVPALGRGQMGMGATPGQRAPGSFEGFGGQPQVPVMHTPPPPPRVIPTDPPSPSMPTDVNVPNPVNGDRTFLPQPQPQPTQGSIWANQPDSIIGRKYNNDSVPGLFD